MAGLAGLLLLDLFVLHRGAHEISIRDAGLSTAGFVAVGLAFGVALAILEGSSVSEQYFAGYLLELSLSLDNVFVWALIFSAFSIPAAYQHRVLFYGIFGALVLRGAFVALGSGLLNRFEWVVYVFGALLVYSSTRSIRSELQWCGWCGAASPRPRGCVAPTCSCAPAKCPSPSGPPAGRCRAAGT